MRYNNDRRNSKIARQTHHAVSKALKLSLGIMLLFKLEHCYKVEKIP